MEGTVAAERPTPRVDAPLGTKLVVDVPDRGTYGVLESDAEFLP